MTDEERAKLADENFRVSNKLAKWRSFFASWQLGTRSKDDGEFRAVKNQYELLILLRADVNALTDMMIKKGVFTQEEFTAALIRESRTLDHAYEQAYPGFSATEDGLSMQLPQALETMHRLGFPP